MDPDHRSSDAVAYAAAVRAALADLPSAEAQALLEDLDDHLAEVAAESSEPLAARLGPPENYAAELRSAYGTTRVQRRTPIVSELSDLGARITGSSSYRELRAFLPELRPAAVVFSGRRVSPIPNPFSRLGIVQIAATAAAVIVSVRLGRRGQPRGRLLSPAALVANWLVAILAIPSLASMGTSQSSVAEQLSSPVLDQAVYAGAPLTNVYPYSRDGKPLSDVLLYDQNGNPLTLAGRDDFRSAYPIGADGQPITNAYPLIQRNPDGTPAARPRVAIPPWPPAANASPTPGPSPAPSASTGS
jgi:hypothetical protein